MKRYPLSLIVIIAICYLSFFTPPETDLNEIPNMDKWAHLCMYGGLTLVIWFEYLWHHPVVRWQVLAGIGILLPIALSGCIEILQATCTENRSGDWFDFVANCIGVLLGVVCSCHITRPFLTRYRQKRDKNVRKEPDEN